jgi:hypothetical protein
MKMLVRASVHAVICAGLLSIAGCNREPASEPPVATPTVTLNKDRAPIGSPLRITYKFQVAADAKIDGDYSVFMHVIEPDGERLWQDDHQPAVPTSKWTPGQTVEYTRTVFVPNYPYIGDANIRLGLYDPPSGKRLSLAAQEVARREYLVGKINLLPQSENIFLIYKEGWHPSEVDPNNATSEWQWTKGTATISFRNPKRDATLYLDSDARPDLFTPPQQIIVKVAGQTVATFAADSKERVLRTFPIQAAQFGTGDMAEIVIEVDRTFTPGGGDTRELGIRVFHAFVEPK